MMAGTRTATHRRMQSDAPCALALAVRSCVRGISCVQRSCEFNHPESAGRRRAAHHPRCRVSAQPFDIVGAFVPRQAAIHREPQHDHQLVLQVATTRLSCR